MTGRLAAELFYTLMVAEVSENPTVFFPTFLGNESSSRLFGQMQVAALSEVGSRQAEPRAKTEGPPRHAPA